MTQPSTPPERILVTGGAGFLGQHLCRRLLEQGHQVICLDNLQTGRADNLRSLFDDERFSFIEHDVIDPICLDVKFTQIYNLACAASPRHYQADPVHTLRTCVQGAYHVLELAGKTGARILQASTSEVYGDPHEHPQSESYRGNVNTVGIRSCYDEGKRAAETLFADFRRSHGVVTRIARIFNTYGPGMSESDGRVISNFIVQALRGQNLTVYGDGSQTRALCFVDDLIDGLMRLMNADPDFQGPVNLGCPKDSTVLEIARRIIRLTGAAVDVEFLPLPADDPVQRRPDIALARSQLGWEPSTPLDDGLRRTIDYFARVVRSPNQEPRRRSCETAPGGCKAFSD